MFCNGVFCSLFTFQILGLKVQGTPLMREWRDRVSQDMGKNGAFWTWQSCCTRELSAAVLACIRSAQDLASQLSGLEEEGLRCCCPHWGIVGSCCLLWKEEFSSGEWSLVTWPCSIWRHHTKIHSGSNNWTSWVLNQPKERYEVGRRMWWRGSGRR